MKKILVPIDFSKKSEEALKVAANIANKINAEIYVLHLIDIPSSEVDMFSGKSIYKGPMAEMLFEKTHEKFDEFLNKDYLNGITIYESVMTNTPVKGISEFAEKHDIDFIVMGSHGTSGIEEFFVGSNTEKVVRTSKIPVLVIKKPASEFRVEKVVITGKYLGHNIKEFKKIMDFLQMFNPDIYLLRVNTISNFKSTKELDEIFDKFLKKVPEYKDLKPVIYDDYTVQEGIFNFAEKIDADLIALSTRGRQGIMHFLADSIAENVVNAANRNILTIKVEN
jgi:nucleotide-binding universal stress UspA family protein